MITALTTEQGLRRLAVAALIATALAVLVVLLGPEQDADNEAFVDGTSSADLLRQSSAMVEAAFTVHPGKAAAAQARAARYLTGSALDRYRELYAPYLAKRGRIDLTTNVLGAGLGSLRDDRAEVLVVARQRAVAGGRSKLGVTELRLQLRHDQDQWVIESFRVM